MERLTWREDNDGYVCPGYRLTARPGETPWRLQAPGTNRAIRSGEPPATTNHRTAADAMAWAEQLEQEEATRLATVLHFSVAGGALVAFVLLAEAIGSLVGLALVAAAFYLTLRSAANGLGLLLKEAWGWTRQGPKRLSPLERWVARAADSRRRRILESVQRPAAVRPLEPISGGPGR